MCIWAQCEFVVWANSHALVQQFKICLKSVINLCWHKTGEEMSKPTEEVNLDSDDEGNWTTWKPSKEDLREWRSKSLGIGRATRANHNFKQRNGPPNIGYPSTHRTLDEQRKDFENPFREGKRERAGQTTCNPGRSSRQKTAPCLLLEQRACWRRWPRPWKIDDEINDENNDSDPTDKELDSDDVDETLAELQKEYESDDTPGAKLQHKQLAKLTDEMRRRHMSDKALKDKLDRQERPENCKNAKPTRVNLGIWRKFRDHTKKSDAQMYKIPPKPL